jgi:AcrR family transcriptional regulator
MPISDCEVRDPRMLRTRRLLQGALRGLLKSRSFENLSVQDIADAATVNRATFYDHYADKHALLEAMIATEFHQLIADRHIRYDGTCASAAGPIIHATCDFMSACSHHPGPDHASHSIEPLVGAAVVAAIRRVLLAGLAGHKPARGASPELVASAAAGAIYGAVKEWAADRRPRAAPKFVGMVLELVGPILAQVEA